MASAFKERSCAGGHAIGGLAPFGGQHVGQRVVVERGKERGQPLTERLAGHARAFDQALVVVIVAHAAGEREIFLGAANEIAQAHVSRRDHVAVYVVRQFRQDRLPEPNHEIVECGFYAANALPEETTRGTRLRIAEVLDGVAPVATWR